ncbi:lysozyme C, milk isozyme-like [Eublepharis macularius]|uniref:Lysozyme C, milk isozyme-like n=1 Tax=Eublepharis macularius TaxID=481883 RepID=A0AA97KRL2_EUBMA|nr:lysozyme C, milk isozyme-like [Eublepharis macularius]
MKVLPLAVFFLLVAVNQARVFGKCELARIFKQHGLDGYAGYTLGSWICLAYYESGYNSQSVGPQNSDGSRDYGIFRINSRWWCSNGEGKTSNGCRTSCSNFTDDDLTDDITCAKRIVRDPSGYVSWVGWKYHCRGTDLSKWTSGCEL